MSNETFQLWVFASSALLLLGAIIAQVATKARRAVDDFARRRKVTVRLSDEGGRLARRLSDELGLPAWGRLRQIAVLKSSVGDGYLFTRYPKRELPKLGGGPPKIVPHHFIALFQPLPLLGRVYLTPKRNDSTRLWPHATQLLSEAFGPIEQKPLDRFEAHPHLAERFEWYAEHPRDVETLLKIDRFEACMLKAPTRETGPLIALMSGGIAMDIDPRLLRADAVERHVAFVEEISRCLAKKEGKAGLTSTPPPAFST